MDDRILLIESSGTIGAESYDDPNYPPENISPLPPEVRPVRDFLQFLPGHDMVDGFEWDSRTPILKDSKNITPEDIAEFADIVRSAGQRFIIITHGTDAMARNAADLKKALEGSGKVVVFTGAMVPLTMFAQHGGDAALNLDYTIQNMRGLEPGVYLTGRDRARRVKFYDPEKVDKDTTLSRKHLVFTVTER